MLWLRAVPALTSAVFIGGAARLVSLLTGTPAMPMEEGWLLPFSPQAAMVTEACAATDFFVILSALLGWHLGGVWRGPVAIVATLVMAVPLTLAINALRIIAVTQAHVWVIPLLPPAYEAFLHLLTGVAVFLPALIGLNGLLEFLHDRLASIPAAARVRA